MKNKIHQLIKEFKKLADLEQANGSSTIAHDLKRLGPSTTTIEEAADAIYDDYDNHIKALKAIIRSHKEK